MDATNAFANLALNANQYPGKNNKVSGNKTKNQTKTVMPSFGAGWSPAADVQSARLSSLPINSKGLLNLLA